MSLNWDIQKMDPADKEFIKSDEQWPRTVNIIHLCMGLGIRGMENEKMAREWYFRYLFYDALHGPVFVVGLTLDDVRRYIGLTTNVTPEPRKSWCKRHAEAYFLEAEYKQRKQEER